MGQVHDSKVVVVEPAAVRTCLAEEACVGVASAAADSLGLGERHMTIGRWTARSSRPTFAMDTGMSYSMTEFAGSGCGHT